MTSQSTPNYDSLAKEVMADAERKAKRAIAQAKRDAEKIADKARQEARALRESILDQARKRAERDAAIVRAGFKIEAKRRDLSHRQDVITKILALARQKLAASNGYDRGESLAKLVAQAVSAIRADALIVRVAPEDRQALDDQFTARVREAVGGNVDIKIGEASISGGAIVESADGRQVYDNSYEARLERLAPTVRLSIARRLFDSQE